MPSIWDDYIMIEQKTIDKSGIVIIQKRYMNHNGVFVQQTLCRQVTDADLPPELRSQGTKPRTSHQADDVQEQEDDNVVVIQPEVANQADAVKKEKDDNGVEIKPNIVHQVNTVKKENNDNAAEIKPKVLPQMNTVKKEKDDNPEMKPKVVHQVNTVKMEKDDNSVEIKPEVVPAANTVKKDDNGVEIKPKVVHQANTVKKEKDDNAAEIKPKVVQQVDTVKKEKDDNMVKKPEVIQREVGIPGSSSQRSLSSAGYSNDATDLLLDMEIETPAGFHGDEKVVPAEDPRHAPSASAEPNQAPTLTRRQKRNRRFRQRQRERRRAAKKALQFIKVDVPKDRANADSSCTFKRLRPPSATPKPALPPYPHFDTLFSHPAHYWPRFNSHMN